MSSENGLPLLADEDFRHLQRLMNEVSGIKLADHKRMLVAGRLMSRLRARAVAGYREYVQLIRQAGEERERRLVIDLLTTNETYFFREPQHFVFLGEWAKRQKRSLRLWSAASSSGEEAFSMAITLAEQAGHVDWSIHGSDLSQRILEKARRATYSLEQARQFPEGLLQRHCLRGVGESDGLFRVRDELRQRVYFEEVNLMQPLPSDLGVFDAIFLRNVLIYFSNTDKAAIVRQLMGCLRPGGLLFIGHAESLHGMNLPLRSIRPSVFERA